MEGCAQRPSFRRAQPTVGARTALIRMACLADRGAMSKRSSRESKILLGAFAVRNILAGRASSCEQRLISLLTAPAIDYNAARRQAQEDIAAKTQLAQQYISRLHKAEAAAKDTLTMYGSRCG